MSVTTALIPATVLKGVTYDMYVTLRDAPGNDGLRMAYYDGTLEIVSPALRHELGSNLFDLIVRAYTAVLDVDCLGVGSTTFRKGAPREKKGKGKEPDTSYYFTNLDLLREKEEIDL